MHFMQIASDANDMSECTRHRFAETMSFVADRVLYATLECLGSVSFMALKIFEAQEII